MKIIGPFVVGEVPPVLQVQFVDSRGNALDISGYTTRFVYRREGQAAVNNAGLVSDGPNGIASYTWVAADMETAGHYEGHVWVGNTDRKLASEKLTWTIEPNLGVVPTI